MPAYRDDREALRARNEALEADLAEARTQLAEVERKLAIRPRADVAAASPAALSPPAAAEASDALTLAAAPPSRRLSIVAHGSAITLLLAGPLVVFTVLGAWPLLVVIGAVALLSSLAHLRALPDCQNGRVYYGLMALFALFPYGGLAAPLPCGMVFTEYQPRTAVPYAIVSLALVLIPVWFYLLVEVIAA